jgi:hypothetical protein
VAVIGRLPKGSVVVVKVATPPLRVPVPSVVAPFLKVTVPFGAGPVDGVTVAVNLTDCPEVDGLTEEVRVVVVGEGFTTCERADEMLAESFVLPT